MPRRVRIRRVCAACLLIVLGALAGSLGLREGASSPSSTAGVVRVPPRPLGVADGAVPSHTTVFADDVPGVTHLDPALLAALRRASADTGIDFVVDSGWRSAAYQRHLLREAVAKYGSEAAARRWVAPPAASAHVSGDAVDLGGAAAGWLAEHGASYGLCQTYGNEPWHFELRPEAVERGCPPPYADPSYDPRLQR